jgi:Sulfocyanin (SoxE) domain
MKTTVRLHLTHVAASLALICFAAACGGGAASNSSPEPTPNWLTFDSGNKSVQLTLISSYNSDNAGLNFNGYSSGKMVLSVPDGWQVTVDCQNHGNGNHSCAIVKNAGDQLPAFPGSASPDPTHGFPNGQHQTFTFQTANPGTYRISCLVPGHDDAGMWDTFVVTAGGEPSIKFG